MSPWSGFLFFELWQIEFLAPISSNERMSVGDSGSLCRTGVSQSAASWDEHAPPALSRRLGPQPRWASPTRPHTALAGTPALTIAWYEAWHQQPAAHQSPTLRLFAIISRKKSRGAATNSLSSAVAQRHLPSTTMTVKCAVGIDSATLSELGVLLQLRLLFSISSLVLYGAPAAGFKFSIIDSGV
jgi:hypothetical protein